MNAHALAPENKSADLSHLRALIIDEGELSRSVVTRMLREMGVAHVHSARRPEQARQQIKDAGLPYDIIITDFHFRHRSAQDMTGQDLLDELRQARGLPMQTAFIMITDEARYQHVADAVEGALDDYLLKPFTAAQFEERLKVVLERKQALHEVFVAIEAADYAAAAQLCEQIFAQDSPYKVYAARIGSELFLRLGQLDAARRMLEALLAFRAVPWARLGLAKIELSTSDSATACRTLETLVAENPAYVDAYDVYGRALLEEMNLAGAAEMFAKAVQITPGNVARQQKLGSLQLFLGQSDAALRHLSLALNLGGQSRALDYQGVVALALAGFDMADDEVLARAKEFMQEAMQRHPDSFRVLTLGRFVELVRSAHLRQSDAALAQITRLAAEAQHPEFSFEMACNFIMILGRMAGRQPIPDANAWTDRLAQRFAVSRPKTLLLEMAGSALPILEDTVKSAAAQINEAAREAMSHLVNKQHERTLRALLDLARSSLNGRIIHLLDATLSHHGKQLEAELAQQLRLDANALIDRYAQGRRFVERGSQV